MDIILIFKKLYRIAKSRMQLSYKQRLVLIIVLLFSLFFISLIYLEKTQQRQYKTANLESKLDAYVQTIHSLLVNNNSLDTLNISKLVSIFPKNVAFTIIDETGKVIYDSQILKEHSTNYLETPEFLKAKFQSYGSYVRFSNDTNEERIYYARHYSPFYIRASHPFVSEPIITDSWNIYLVLVLFFVVLLLVNIVAGRFNKSISKLRDFSQKIKQDQPLPQDQTFPNDELGEIGADLVEIFNQKETSKQSLEIQHSKLVQHFQHSGIGLCLFNQDLKKILTNTYFMQYLNLILDKPTLDVTTIFEYEPFNQIKEFIECHDSSDKYMYLKTERNRKIFSIQTIIFDDDSFEVTIRDITKIEKNRLLKQEMTSNVAHELRTPVTSIRGYIETMKDQSLSVEKQKQFIDRAYQQIMRLSTLIEDVSLLSNIEETPSRYIMETINISQILNEVRIDLTDKLEQHSIHLSFTVNDSHIVKGNYTLLYSIFRNLIDNSINYGGDNIAIYINNYMSDETYLYFSYYDTGKGVDDKHLNKLFERFYRAEEGRTRNSGGSGLGLSIVRNSIQLHKGQIEVRNKQGAGLEFLFTLPKCDINS